MVFINHRHDQPPELYPRDPHVVYGTGFNPTYTDSNGMHSRTDVEPEYLAAITQRLLHDPSIVGLYDWQLWGQGSWKEFHGSHAGVERFGGKLREEYTEFLNTLQPRSTKYSDELRRKICDEAGDVAWCALALTSNASGNIEDGIKNYLFEAVQGIRYIDEMSGKLLVPPWKKQAAELCTTTDAERQLTIGDIDALVTKGMFVPEPGNQMNIFYIPGEDYDEDPDAQEYAFWMLGDIIALQNLAEQQYGYGERDRMVGSTTYMLFREAINAQAAKILFQLAYVIHKSCGGSLDEAIALNTVKLQTRMALNLVDKTDGERHPEAL